MTDAVTETITVSGEMLTVSLLVWRRFRQPMPGLVEQIYALNPELAEHGAFLTPGTSFQMPIPIPRPVTRAASIKLW